MRHNRRLRLRNYGCGSFSLDFRLRRFQLYAYRLKSRIDSDGCPVRNFEWNLVLGSHMLNGECYWTGTKPRRRR